MAYPKHRVVWCDPGWLPVHFGFCPSKKAWRREMKKMGLKGEPFPSTDGRMTEFAPMGGKKPHSHCFIVTIGHSDDHLALLGLIAHEAQHVWQYLKRYIGETNPGDEMEAYSYQSIYMELIDAYVNTRGALNVEPRK